MISFIQNQDKEDMAEDLHSNGKRNAKWQKKNPKSNFRQKKKGSEKIGHLNTHSNEGLATKIKKTNIDMKTMKHTQGDLRLA